MIAGDVFEDPFVLEMTNDDERMARSLERQGLASA